MQKLPQSYFLSDDVVHLAKDLIGKYLFVNTEDVVTGGIIVETEAYKGPEDVGSHAYNHRRTNRNDIMYSAGGVVYMYICYGIHDMLNIVTGPENTAHAILIRAIQPTEGLDVMRERRKVRNEDSRLCRGPGALAKALALKKVHNGISLQDNEIWIEDRGPRFQESELIAGPRIGLNISEPYKSIPWRFYVKGNPHVSRPHL
ncbi:MAG TPA: DNA-3-methyladenine glycosylase [Sphingobacteriaceae bacterium]